MSTQEIIENILKNTYVRSDLYRRTGLLKEFLEHTFFAGHAHDDAKNLLQEFLKERGGEHKEDTEAMMAWGDVTSGFSENNLGERLKELGAEIKNLPSIIVYLPVSFDKEDPKLLESLGRWFREQVSSRMVMDIKVDPNVAGGCAFVWNGVYHDFSFRNFLTKHETELREALRTYGGNS